MKKIIGTFLIVGSIGALIGVIFMIVGYGNDSIGMIDSGVIVIGVSLGVLLGTLLSLITGRSKDRHAKRQENSIDESDSEIQKSIESTKDFQKNKLNEISKSFDEPKGKEQYRVKVGQTVYHRGGFGLGTVKALQDKTVLIKFKNGTEYKFAFPDAVLEGYLIKARADSGLAEPVAAQEVTRPLLPQKGIVVVHKDFGTGEISDISGKYITVRFADKERKFVYPDAFQKGHLVLKGEEKSMQPNQGKSGAKHWVDTKFWNIFTDILEENGEPFQFKQINREIGEATIEGAIKALTIRLLPERGTIEIIAQEKYYKFEFKANRVDDFSRIAENVIVKINDIFLHIRKKSPPFDIPAENTKGTVNNFIVRYAVSPQNENGIREMNVRAGEKYLMVYDAGCNCVGVVFKHFENRPVPANGQAEICFFNQYYNSYGRWHRMFYGGHQSGERIKYSDLVKEVASKGEYRYAGYIRP